jgi:hypothetical protein
MRKLGTWRLLVQPMPALIFGHSLSCIVLGLKSNEKHPTSELTAMKKHSIYSSSFTNNRRYWGCRFGSLFGANDPKLDRQLSFLD